MKYITFTVPCYNSQAYMRKCVDSLLTGGEDVEIIIVNDGSKDDTINIANEYKEKYPTIVKVVDKENGGHGSGVNAGVKNATGLYLKIVDSDDWVDTDALKKLLDTVKEHVEKGENADLYITNFVYEKVEEGTRHVSAYGKKMPEGRFFGWEEVKNFHFSHMLLMHALLYRTEVIRQSGTVLPEHTFYVDNLYAFRPLPFAKKLYYLNVDLYRYFIGRVDQSVNLKNMSKRYDQQIRVMKHIVTSYTWDEIKAQPKGLKSYLWHCINAVNMNTIFFTCVEDSPERRAALKEYWQTVKAFDKKLYRKMRTRSYALAVNYLPWKLRGWVMKVGYEILCKTVKLG